MTQMSERDWKDEVLELVGGEADRLELDAHWERGLGPRAAATIILAGREAGAP